MKEITKRQILEFVSEVSKYVQSGIQFFENKIVDLQVDHFSQHCR